MDPIDFRPVGAAPRYDSGQPVPGHYLPHRVTRLARDMDTIPASASRNFVLFNTDLFVFRQPDDGIDRWTAGGDCAGWFYTRLLLAGRIRPERDPTMEDWGWTFAVSANKIKANANVWPFHEIENCWLIGLASRNHWLRRRSPIELDSAQETVADSLDQIMMSDSRIVKHVWFAPNPLGMPIRSFQPHLSKEYIRSRLGRP